MIKNIYAKYFLWFAVVACLPLSIYADDFMEEGLIYDIRDSASVRVVGCDATYSDSIDVPSEITHGGISYYVRSIAPSAFAGKATLKSIELSSLDSICQYAFSGCTGLTRLTIPSNVEYIGSYAFNGCKFDYLIIRCSELSSPTDVFAGLDTETPLFYNGKNIEYSYIKARYSGQSAYFYQNGTVFKRAYICCDEASTVSMVECSLREVSYDGNIIETMDSVAFTINGNSTGAWTTSFDPSTHHVSIKGLEPGTSYFIKLQPYRYYKNDKYWSKTGVEASWSVNTDELILTTEQPKVLSSTSAAISATTNIDESETSVGFEWRKIDAPDEVASKSATAEIYDGVLSGVIKGLSESTYYKYRAYYTSASDSTYYSDWVGIDTDDYSYFEPTVKTGDVEVSESSVTAKGYALQGTEDIEEQGFEYWIASSSAKSSRVSSKAAEDGVTKVTVDGQKMTATLTDLLTGTTYEIRAFATTASGTTYGETVQFTTAETTGIQGVTVAGGEELSFLVRQSDGLQIAVTGSDKSECLYHIFSITGSMVASGQISVDGNWYSVTDANALEGVYVIVVSDGSETKAKKLFVK